MKHSGRVIIVENEHVLLIKRVKKDQVYYVFPGGKAEKGETPEMTARREAYEELGVQVDLGSCFAEVKFNGVRQFYFHASISGGELGSGTAEEFTTGEGTFELVWMACSDLINYPVIPAEVAEKLACTDKSAK